MQNRWLGILAVVMLTGGCAAPDIPQEPSAPLAEAAPQGIVPNARVTWQKTYTKCGHSSSQVQFVEPEMVGRTLQDYAAYHLGYAVEGDMERITLNRYIYQYCPDHYIIKDDGGALALFRNEEGGEELARICRLRYQASDLPEDIRSLVYEGIPYGDIAELEAMLRQVRAEKNEATLP